MSGALDAAVVGLGLYTAFHPNLEAFRKGEVSAEPQLPGGRFLDARTRRRASTLTRAMADAYAEAMAASGLDPASIASVFGSALGEAGTMLSLLDQMFRTHEPVSPMRFVTSVHNTASGLISISGKNRGFTTSLGADFDTPAMSILEALGLIHADRVPAIVCCADEGAPEDLVPEEYHWALLAGAIALVHPEEAPPGSMRLRLMGMGPDESAASNKDLLEPPEISLALSKSPVVGILDLLVALAEGREGRVRLDRGKGRGFIAELFRGD